MLNNGQEVAGYTVSAGNMIKGADYKSVLMPDAIHIGIIIIIAIIAAIGIKAVAGSSNKYAGLILMSVMLGVAGLVAAVCVFLGV